MPRKQKKYHYIYKTTCLITSKFYIGMHSTDNLDDGYLGSGKIIRRSIKKYGAENHSFEVLEFASTRKELSNRERVIVNNSLIENVLCMNLRLGGEGGSSGHSIETRLKISESRKGQINNKWEDKSRAKMSQYRTGRKHTAETKEKVSRANTGASRSEDFRRRVSETLKLKSEEIGKRQRQAILGRHFYNDGITVILTYASDPRLSDKKWKKGKVC